MWIFTSAGGWHGTDKLFAIIFSFPPTTSEFLAVAIFHSWKKQEENNPDYADKKKFNL